MINKAFNWLQSGNIPKPNSTFAYKNLLVQVIAIIFDLIHNLKIYFQQKQSFELTVKLFKLCTNLVLISIEKQITDRVSRNEKVFSTTSLTFYDFTTFPFLADVKQNGA